MLPLVEMMLVLQIAAPGGPDQLDWRNQQDDPIRPATMLQTTDEVIEALALIKGRGRASAESVQGSTAKGFAQ